MNDSSNSSQTSNESNYPKYLPFFKPVVIPPLVLDHYPVLPTLIPEACGGKVIMGGIFGSVMGLGLGFFLGAMGDQNPIQIIQGREVPQAPLREQLRSSTRALWARSSGSARTFGVLSALIGGIECVVEKQRAKHDIWNPVISGCIVGGTMGASGGPGSACLGCAGFAGFSVLMEKIMGPH